MPYEGRFHVLKTNAKFIYIEIIAVIILVISVILLCVYNETLGSEQVVDYTDCENFDKPTITCKDTLKTQQSPCICYIEVNITEPIGKYVTVYYELDTYDQGDSSYYTSRDDKQLMGVLSQKPSASCGPYSYINMTEGTKPIAPCGGIADSMFNDTFSLRKDDYVPSINTGLMSEADKAAYRNPPGNLEEAFKNFSKPINWVHNVWELDTLNNSNNGFQNEAFIAWMRTDWKRKPVWRVNNTDIYKNGIPVGAYTLRVEYAYPPSRYDGRRKFIISSIHYVINPVKLGLGIGLLILGIIVLICKIFYNRRVYGEYIKCEKITN